MATIKQEMEVFADGDNYPILYYCSAGRDRTGTLSFLLLAMVGVSLEDIYFDFELSFLSSVGAPSGSHTTTSFCTSIAGVYDYINTYEGDTLKEKTWNYLLATGLTEE